MRSISGYRAALISPHSAQRFHAYQRHQLDLILFLSVIGLLLIGLVMVASSSMAIAEHYGLSAFYFFLKQFVFAMLGLTIAWAILYVPSAFWQRMGSLWLGIGIIMLILVLVPGVGHVVNGSRRWIRIGPVALQVSEFVKLCGLMYIAHYLVKYGPYACNAFIGVMKPLLLLGLMGVLLLLEPDFGATVVLFLTAFGMMFMAGVRVRWFVLLLSLAGVAMSMLIIFSPYRLARLTGFLHPWENQFGSGYQLTQALIAFGNGGWFGVGLGESMQKLFYLPEAHTDFVVAILAEELGFIGILFVLGLYVLMVWRGLVIAKTAHLTSRLFPALVAYGITFWLGMQVMVNIGVNIGLLPTKGLTLPFMSYGGSSLVIDLAVIAILLRIDLENHQVQSGWH